MSLHSLLHNYYFREDGIITINLFKFKIHLSALNKSLYKYTNPQFFIITLNVLNLNSTLNFKQVIFSIHKQINNYFFFIDIRHKKHIRWDFSRVLDLSRFVWLLDYVYYCTVLVCVHLLLPSLMPRGRLNFMLIRIIFRTGFAVQILQDATKNLIL